MFSNYIKLEFCNTPHPVPCLPPIYIERERKGREKRRERERELTRFWPGNPTRPATLTRPVLPFPATVPGKVGTNSTLERWAMYPCRPCCRKTIGKPPIEALKYRRITGSIRRDFAGFRWSHHLDFVLYLSLCHFQLTIDVGDVVFLLIGHWRIYNFGSSIRSHYRAWEVITATFGLSVAWTFSYELPVAVGWILVTVDQQGYFGNFTI